MNLHKYPQFNYSTAAAVRYLCLSLSNKSQLKISIRNVPNAYVYLKHLSIAH